MLWQLSVGINIGFTIGISAGQHLFAVVTAPRPISHSKQRDAERQPAASGAGDAPETLPIKTPPPDARVLTQESRIILADEPVASLDPAAAVSVLSLLREIAHESGIAVLCSLHQVDLVPGFADRVLGLRAGRLVTDNTVEHFQILANRQIYVASEGKFVG